MIFYPRLTASERVEPIPLNILEGVAWPPHRTAPAMVDDDRQSSRLSVPAVRPLSFRPTSPDIPSPPHAAFLINRRSGAKVCPL